MKSYEDVARNVFARREQYELAQQRKRTALRRAAMGLQVLVIAMMVFFTAGIGYAIAAGIGIIDDFLGIFGIRGQRPLSKSQQQFISDAAVELGESVTSSGVTVTAKGAFTDGTTAFILLEIEAPEGTDLESHALGLDGDAKGIVRGDNAEKHLNTTGLSTSHFCLDDSDGRSNTRTMLIQINTVNLPGSNFSFADGYYRYLRLREIFYHQEEYPYTKRSVAVGNWEFKFLFTDMASDPVELLDAPMQFELRRSLSSGTMTATVHSISMRGLSIVFYHSITSELAEPGDFGDVQVILKDGTVIRTTMKSAQGAGNGTDFLTSYVASVPITIPEVDHILVGGTVIIPVPQS